MNKCLNLLIHSFTHFTTQTHQMDTHDKNTKQPVQYKKGDKYIVPPEGSLGLLALGHQGLIAWRKARTEAQELAKQKAGDIKVEVDVIELPIGTDE